MSNLLWLWGGCWMSHFYSQVFSSSHVIPTPQKPDHFINTERSEAEVNTLVVVHFKWKLHVSWQPQSCASLFWYETCLPRTLKLSTVMNGASTVLDGWVFNGPHYIEPSYIDATERASFILHGRLCNFNSSPASVLDSWPQLSECCILIIELEGSHFVPRFWLREGGCVALMWHVALCSGLAALACGWMVVHHNLLYHNIMVLQQQ